MTWSLSSVDTKHWQAAAERLQSGTLTLLGLWGEPSCAHMALMDRATKEFTVLTLACADHRFPLRWPTASAGDPARAHDARPVWPRGGGTSGHPPLARSPRALSLPAVEGESLHQIPVGPVHAGIIEPGHFRFTANGETVARLEQRLGYAHKGTESLLAGAPLERAALLAGRVSGDSTVAFALAFSRPWRPRLASKSRRVRSGCAR